MRIHPKLVLLLLVIVQFLNAQDSAKIANNTTFDNPNLFKVGVSVGAFNYNGDVGMFSQIGTVNDLRMGYVLTLSQRFFEMFSANVNGFYGKVSKSERTGTRNLNFESSVMGGDLCLGFHLDNKYLLQNGKLAPYIYGGIGYFAFNPKGDLKNGSSSYYYWSNGSIRDIAETSDNIAKSKEIERDYKYETPLNDPNNKYSKTALAFPVGLGVKAKIHRNFDFVMNGTYYFAKTDFLDNFQAGSANDGFWTANMGILVNFQKREEKPEEPKTKYDEVNIKEIVLKGDKDGDGVLDINDQCPATPSGNKVDSKGCPLDDDKDGVPDYADLEKESGKNAVVNNSGVTITDSIFQAAYNDSIVMEHEIVCNVYPSLCGDVKKKTEDKTDLTKNKKSKLNAPYSNADANNDGVITTEEIYKVIDKFFDQSINIKSADINKIIDYFFEQ